MYSKKIIALIVAGAILVVGAGCGRASDQPQVSYKTGDVKSFTVMASNWKFDPGTITVKKGDQVHLTVIGSGNEHSLAIREYNINISVADGETKTYDFVADKAGTFTFFCAIPCGPGHRDMTGTLIVE